MASVVIPILRRKERNLSVAQAGSPEIPRRCASRNDKMLPGNDKMLPGNDKIATSREADAIKLVGTSSGLLKKLFGG